MNALPKIALPVERPVYTFTTEAEDFNWWVTDNLPELMTYYQATDGTPPVACSFHEFCQVQYDTQREYEQDFPAEDHLDDVQAIYDL